jgi:hypothetical protein
MSCWRTNSAYPGHSRLRSDADRRGDDTLLILGPRVEDAVVSHMSTNVHNLARGLFATLVGSVFVTSSGFIPAALAELFWRGERLILAFGLGHVGATLIVAVSVHSSMIFFQIVVDVDNEQTEVALLFEPLLVRRGLLGAAIGG